MILWMKALHLIAAMAWMAGLLYLPRLFVYHAMAERDSEQAKTFAVMERRLQKAIMTPAMVAAFVFGGSMIVLNPEYLQQNWFLAKAGLVIILAFVHGKFAKMRKDFEAGGVVKSQRYYRIWNEVPAVLMVVIVILAVVRPF